MTTDTSEKGLERLICVALTGSPCDLGAPRPDLAGETAAPFGGSGWIGGAPGDYEREYCVDLVQLRTFLQATQSEVAEALDLDHADRRIDAAIAQNTREISLLREYRTRLIADVVTGKLDVREAATHLPEETGEPEPLDDTDTSPNGVSEETEATDPDAAHEEAEA